MRRQLNTGKLRQSKFRPLSSLVFLTTMSVLVLTLIIMVAGGYFITKQLYKTNFENLQREARSAAQFSAETIARPMWDINHLGAQENLESLGKNLVFCGARVTDDDNKIFADSHFPAQIDNEKIIISEIIHFNDPNDDTATPKNIGKLEVCATMAPIKAQIKTIITQLAQAFSVISIFILLAMHFSLQILMRPLLRFKEAMGGFLHNMKPITDPTLMRENEVGDLVKSFNTLAISLSESYRALKKAKEQAEESFRVKTDFFANMSHELRTPLNSVIGMTQLMETTTMSAEQREMFDSIKRSASALLKIVNDILDISKIEAHQIQLEYIAFDLHREIRHTVQSLLPMAARKGLTMTFEDPGKPLPVFGDPLRYTRILTNIIGNAVHYTDRGFIDIRCKVTRKDKHIIFTVDVEDTGIGISSDKIDTIFEKFTQGDTSTTRKYGGTGLGLTITRELVELMGGNISVSSIQGRGSVFSFFVPFEAANLSGLKASQRADEFTDGTPQAISGIEAAHARILIAEDHTMNQIFMRKLCKNLGLTHYTIAENGREALHELQSSSFDLVLMDCHMPEMNGYDSTIAIRNLDDPIKRNIPIVAMTANAMPEDELRCLACGMNGYLSKPIDIRLFKKTLGAWINFEDKEPLDMVAFLNDVTSNPVNLANLKANSMGDTAFEREMIGMFITQAVTQMDELHTRCVDGEDHMWVEIAHALKGTAGNIGAETMRALCAEAQNMANSTSTARGIILARISDEYAKAKTYLIDNKLYVPES